MREGKEIFNTRGMAQSIRYTDYKDIYSAISELVDNSIEAKSKNICVAVYETLGTTGKEQIGDIGIIDDGHGMDKELLHECLVFGSSTKHQRKSMGRFGVGLGQASLFAAPRVEVYSWQKTNEIFSVYLDTDKMRKGEQDLIPYPTKSVFPRYFNNFMHMNSSKYAKFDCREHGTFVLWKFVDKVTVKNQTFYERLAKELGRKFRYYIDNGVNIYIANTSLDTFIKVQSIDPLFLMKNSRFQAVKGTYDTCDFSNSTTESIFEPFISDVTPNGEYVIPVRIDKEHKVPINSNIKLKFSIVKSQYYYSEKLRRIDPKTRKVTTISPGDTSIGKVLKAYERISVVRAHREIDFDRFNLYESVNDPANRFWGAEIEFSPVLDEFFKLSNNKQKVEIIAFQKRRKATVKNTLDLEELVNREGYMKNAIISDLSLYGDFEDEIAVWIHLNTVFNKVLYLIKKRNKMLHDTFKHSDSSLSTMVPKASERLTSDRNYGAIDLNQTQIIANQVDKINLKSDLVIEKIKRNVSLKKAVNFIDLDESSKIFDSRMLFNQLTCEINWDKPLLREFLNNPSKDSIEDLVRWIFGSFVKTKESLDLEERKIFDKILNEFNTLLQKFDD